MKNEKVTVNSLLRGSKILKTIAQFGEIGTTKIAKEVGLHKSTVSRFLYTLQIERLVEKNPETGNYRLGIGIFELGMSYSDHMDLRQRGRRYLREVVDLTQEVAHLGVIDQSQIVYLEKVESPHNLSMMSRVGARVSLHSTSLGKAILAYLPSETLENLLKDIDFRKFTAKTIDNSEDLLDQLQDIRQKGYSIDDEENEEGIRCIGVPVLNYDGEAIGAISISGPTLRITYNKVKEFAPTLKEVGLKLSKEIGFRC